MLKDTFKLLKYKEISHFFLNWLYTFFQIKEEEDKVFINSPPHLLEEEEEEGEEMEMIKMMVERVEESNLKRFQRQLFCPFSLFHCFPFQCQYKWPCQRPCHTANAQYSMPMPICQCQTDIAKWPMPGANAKT